MHKTMILRILMAVVGCASCRPTNPHRAPSAVFSEAADAAAVFSEAADAAAQRADRQGRVKLADGASAKLRLLETTDLHVNLESFNYYRNKPDLAIGFVRTAELIRKSRAEVTNSMLFDAGDLIQGSPLGDWFRKTKEPSQDLHSAFKALNLVGYDAAVIGNHEFNFGLDFLASSLRGAAFPYVSANVKRLASGSSPATTLVPPYVLLKRTITRDDGGQDEITVGVLGLTPPQIMTWDRTNLQERLTADDMVDAARAVIPRMKAEGADIIVVIAHTGLTARERVGGDESAVNYLAQIPEVDVLLAGHQHLVFPSQSFADSPAVDLQRGLVAGVPTVMAGAFGSHVGVVDLELKKIDGQWQVASGHGAVRDLTSWLKPEEFAADVRAAIATDHAATTAYLSKPIGATEEPMDSYWAQIAPSPVVEVVQQAQLAFFRKAIAEGGASTEALRNLPLLSAAAPMQAGYKPDLYNDQPVGALSLRNVAEFYIYPNTVRLVKLNGAELRDWLEMSAGAFNQIIPDLIADQLVINPQYKAYNFDEILGLEYAIDISQPARFKPNGDPQNAEARRIVDLTYQGRPISDTELFLIATHNYRANGGGGFPHLNGEQVVFDPGKDALDVVTDYVEAMGTLPRLKTQNWRILPVAGASLILRSGPAAKDHLATSPRPVHYVGMDADGFARYKLD